MFWKSPLYMSTSSLFLIRRIHTEFLVIIFDRAENRSSTLLWKTWGDCCLKSFRKADYFILITSSEKTFSLIASRKKNTWNIVKITFSCGNYNIFTFFSCCLPETRAKDHRKRSPFFEFQAKYLWLELETSGLSRGTQKLSSGSITARYVKIWVRYSS